MTAVQPRSAVADSAERALSHKVLQEAVKKDWLGSTIKPVAKAVLRCLGVCM